MQKTEYMQIVSAREFRSNQGRFLTAARQGQSVMLTSRFGNFKIVPVTDDDEIVRRELQAAISEVKDHLDGKISLPNAKDIQF